MLTKRRTPDWKQETEAIHVSSSSFHSFSFHFNFFAVGRTMINWKYALAHQQRVLVFLIDASNMAMTLPAFIAKSKFIETKSEAFENSNFNSMKSVKFCIRKVLVIWLPPMAGLKCRAKRISLMSSRTRARSHTHTYISQVRIRSIHS